MKKSLYHYFSYDMYRHAPESFNLTFKGKRVDVSPYSRDKYRFGYILATKGKEELMKVVKQYIRRETIFKQEVDSFRLAIMLKTGKQYITINYPVRQYDIQEKLRCYKMLKESLAETNYKSPVTVMTAELDGAGNVIRTEDRTEIMELSKRIRLI